jgi:hypothetical protein
MSSALAMSEMDSGLCSEFSERIRPLVRSRNEWGNHIKIDLKEILCGDVYWIHLA